MSDFTGPITYNFTGMDPNQTYDIALYSARGPYSSGTPRDNRFIISDVDVFTKGAICSVLRFTGKFCLFRFGIAWELTEVS